MLRFLVTITITETANNVIKNNTLLTTPVGVEGCGVASLATCGTITSSPTTVTLISLLATLVPIPNLVTGVSPSVYCSSTINSNGNSPLELICDNCSKLTISGTLLLVPSTFQALALAKLIAC